jgi:D-alanyl-D-alanine dipeptidase
MLSAQARIVGVILFVGFASLCALEGSYRPPARSLSSESPRSAGFVDLAEVDPSILLDIRYSTQRNFVGKRIAGYLAPKCLLTREAAGALKRVQDHLRRHNRFLRVYDCYRPRKAVQDFVAWFKEKDSLRDKETYYPHVKKSDLFKDSYLSSKSGHSRGSTVDLTIEGLDMGTPFDFFDPLSHTAAEGITPEQKQNRQLLKSAMEKSGYRNLDTEWWHYTLKSEPFSDQYFDFDIR